MSNLVETVEDRIQNAILTALDNIVTSRTELAVRLSSGRDVASVTANSDSGKQIAFVAPRENVSGMDITFCDFNIAAETRGYNLDEISEILVSETHFDGQAHTHHLEIAKFQKSVTNFEVSRH